MVEVHGAHGYLLDAFLDPALHPLSPPGAKPTSELEDIIRRAEFPCRVVAAIRAALGPGVPISYRFSQWKLNDYACKKFRTSSCLAAFLSVLHQAGVDVFHPSTRRILDTGFPDEHPTRTLAGWTKLCLNPGPGAPLPVVVGVGSITLEKPFGEQPVATQAGPLSIAQPHSKPAAVADPGPALALLEPTRGECDVVAVGRGMLVDPEWAAKVLAGRWQELLPFSLEHEGRRRKQV